MRRKTLLVGASSPFEGPWVHLEKGKWLVEPNPVLENIIWISEESGKGIISRRLESEVLNILGPCKVKASVTSGKEIFLDIGQEEDKSNA